MDDGREEGSEGAHKEDLAVVERICTHVLAMIGGLADPAVDPVTRLAERRRAILSGACVGGAYPAIRPTTRIVPSGLPGFAGEWVLAKDADPRRRLLYIHGGGWVMGRAVDYRHMMERLSAELGAAVFALDYRLAPEHPWPAGPDDCLAAWQTFCARGPAGPLAADALWLAGDSAGGNLALVLLQDLKAAGARLPDAVATCGAVTDFSLASETFESCAQTDPMITREGAALVRGLYLPPGTDLTDPRASPLAGDLAGLPPTLLHAGEREVLMGDSLAYAAKAEAAGSPATVRIWPGMIHVFEWYCHLLPAARRALAEMAAFLKSHAKAG